MADCNRLLVRQFHACPRRHGFLGREGGCWLAAVSVHQALRHVAVCQLGAALGEFYEWAGFKGGDKLGSCPGASTTKGPPQKQ